VDLQVGSPGTKERINKAMVVKKNLIYKNQGWEPIHQKYKAYESTSNNLKKKKRKPIINEFLKKINLMQI
jgi:hypothetical protein